MTQELTPPSPAPTSMSTSTTTSASTSAPAPLLPGQAAAPPGPCDLTGMYVMHHAFRRDLARTAAAVVRTPLTDSAAWAGLARWWGWFAGFLLEHHTKEDEALWPLLRELAAAHGDTDALAVLDAMEAEHHDIDPLLDAAAAGWPRLVAGATEVHRRAQVEVVSATARVLDAHLRHEEEAAIALVQRWIGAAEWSRLLRSRLADKPSPRALLFFLPWAADDAPADVVAHLLADGGAPVRWLLALGERGYRRRRATAFRHVPGGPAAVGAAEVCPRV